MFGYMFCLLMLPHFFLAFEYVLKGNRFVFDCLISFRISHEYHLMYAMCAYVCVHIVHVRHMFIVCAISMHTLFDLVISVGHRVR